VKTTSSQRRVGLIGIGLLGSALAQRAIQAGYTVAGYDNDARGRLRLKKMGGFPLNSAANIARSQRTILLALPDSSISLQVVKEMESALVPGTIILDTTTGDPEEMAALGRRLGRRRVRYLDTTILGSSADVAAGRGVIMAGGARRDFLRHRHLLGCFAQKQFHLGRHGAGAKMKLAANLVLGLNRAALAEGLAFANAIGVPPARALEVLGAGAAYSRVMDAKGPKMLRRNFKPVARLAQHLKDVRLILEAARRGGLALPLTMQHEQLLARVARRGGGELDNSAVILAYD
jgi:3-hydroxyisobutyrate dehydrogenase-like beta-hydroxyacid dehydrogenase